MRSMRVDFNLSSRKDLIEYMFGKNRALMVLISNNQPKIRRRELSSIGAMCTSEVMPSGDKKQSIKDVI